MRWLLGAAVLTATLIGCSAQPLRVSAAGSSDPSVLEACQRLAAQLPEQVADQPRREVTPAEGLGAAWGDPAIVLSCRVPAPAGFDRVASCTSVNGVDWFIPAEQLEAGGDLTMTVVNREVHVQAQLPATYLPPATALADLSDPVKRALEPTGHCY